MEVGTTATAFFPPFALQCTAPEGGTDDGDGTGTVSGSDGWMDGCTKTYFINVSDAAAADFPFSPTSSVVSSITYGGQSPK